VDTCDAVTQQCSHVPSGACGDGGPRDGGVDRGDAAGPGDGGVGEGGAAGEGGPRGDSSPGRPDPADCSCEVGQAGSGAGDVLVLAVLFVVPLLARRRR
jgi:MYXO-CTERM domain-containing protein